MKRLIVIAFCFFTMLAGCKSKNNPSGEIDSTQINANGIDAVTLEDGTRVFAIADLSNNMSVDLFKGSADDKLLEQLCPDGQFQSSINVFVIASGEDVVLVDAGLGSDNGGMLMAKLSVLGILPDNVKAVILTHLHSDHIGGLLRGGQPAFPNAELYLSVDEFNAWADGGVLAERNGHWKEVLASYANKVNLLQDGDTIIDGLAKARLAVGHTPGHTIYQVGNLMFVGDLLHAQDLQLEHPEYCARYDGDYEQSVVTRRQVLELVKTNGLTLCGAHCYEPFVNL